MTRTEPEQPLNLTDCAERGFRYEPPDMFLTFRPTGSPKIESGTLQHFSRTTEPNYESCRSRCKLTVYCRDLRLLSLET